jgi:tRNA pseudouridine-54 N-methylase
MEDLTLDGNAAAGLLEEVFPFELTTARATCDNCRRVAELATAMAFAQTPGLVVRCRHCEAVLVRIATDGNRYWLDMRGVRCLEIHP